MSFINIVTERGSLTEDGLQARYCTVDHSQTGSGSGQVELVENGAAVTVFNQICTDFTQRQFGNDDIRVEAYTSEVDQIRGTAQSQDPGMDVELTHVLFLVNTVQIIGGVPTGTVLFVSPAIPLIRMCGIQSYTPQNPGSVHGKLGGEVLRRADAIGLIHLSWLYGRSC